MSVEVMSLVVAGMAVVVGPVISWKIAKAHIASQVVSANRQEWINTIRNIVAGFLRDSRSVIPVYMANTYSMEKTFEVFDRMVLATEQIELMLNPKENDHAEMIRLMRSALELVRGALSEISQGQPTSNDKERMTAITAIMPLAQGIFKSEWNRIKSGE